MVELYTMRGVSKSSMMINALEIIEENEKLKKTLYEIKELAKSHDYWSSNLRLATDLINEILKKSEEIEGLDDE